MRIFLIFSMKSTCSLHISTTHHKKTFLSFRKVANHHALSSEGSMTPYQLFFEGVNHLVRYYGYSVPSLDGDIDDVSELTGEHVNVPRISFIPCTLLTHNLHNIDPLGAC